VGFIAIFLRTTACNASHILAII